MTQDRKSLRRNSNSVENADFEREYNKEDPHTSWIFQPHTITILFVGLAVVVAFAFNESNNNFETNVKYGLGAVSLMFLVFSSVQMKDGLFYRPHPMIWRLVTGLAVLYLSAMVFILFQTVDDARQLIKKIDPSLGKPLPERSYAENCDLYTPYDTTHPFRNLYDTVNDEFILAHLLGWFGKGLLLRDAWLCWILSIFFEILEVTFQHMLPNFKECWWDHIILDILVCNWLGFYLARKFIQYFKIKPYNFIAPSMDEYHWEVLTNWKRLVYVVSMILAISVVELNAFFLKFVLWIPPPHPINIVRLLIWWGIGLPGVREYYYYVTDKKCKKFGPMSWLCVANMVIEVLICIKFGKGLFPAPHPDEVVIPWAISSVLFVMWGIWFYGFHNRSKSENTNDDSAQIEPKYINKDEQSKIQETETKKKKKPTKKDE